MATMPARYPELVSVPVSDAARSPTPVRNRRGTACDSPSDAAAFGPLLDRSRGSQTPRRDRSADQSGAATRRPDPATETVDGCRVAVSPQPKPRQATTPVTESQVGAPEHRAPAAPSERRDGAAAATTNRPPAEPSLAAVPPEEAATGGKVSPPPSRDDATPAQLHTAYGCPATATGHTTVRPPVSPLNTAPSLVGGRLPLAGSGGDKAETAPPSAIRGQILRQLLLYQDYDRGSDRLTLQLEPERLGRVVVELRQEGGRLSVVFDAESTAAREALREGGRELTACLLERGGGRWAQVEVKTVERDDEQRHPDTDKRRGQPRQQRQRDESEGRDRRGPGRG